MSYKKRSVVIIIAAALLAAVNAGCAANIENGQDFPIEAAISYNGKSTPIASGDSETMPFAALGSTVSLSFKDSRPEAVTIIEVLAGENGERKYPEQTDKTVCLTYEGDNAVTFTVEKNSAGAFSSNSRDYAPGRSFRWYRVICNEGGEGTEEYGLWLRTDPPFIF